MKIAVVSYINTIPFRYGIEKSPLKPADVAYLFCPPSECAVLLKSGKAEGGLIPVAAIPSLNKHYVFSDYCISANQQAYSVLLLSRVPLQEVEKVILDYQSRSSVDMFRLLNKHYLHYNFSFEEGYEGFENHLSGLTAGVVIGDRAMKYRDGFEYVYDIAELWIEHTGLPAVFALWVSTRPFAPKMKADFDSMMRFGLTSINEAIEYYHTSSDKTMLQKYMTDNLNYCLDNDRRKSVDLFLSMLTGTDFKVNF